MSDRIMLAKLAIGVAGTALGAAVASSPRLHAPSNRRFTLIAFALGAAARLGVYALVFLVLGYAPHSDVGAHYWPQAKHALLGHVPYRDFASSYAPLFPYVESL